MDYSFSSNVVICAKLYCYSWNAVIIVEENACTLAQWKILLTICVWLIVSEVLHGNWCVMTDDTLFFSAMHSQLCVRKNVITILWGEALPTWLGGGGAIILVHTSSDLNKACFLFVFFNESLASTSNSIIALLLVVLIYGPYGVPLLSVSFVLQSSSLSS